MPHRVWKTVLVSATLVLAACTTTPPAPVAPPAPAVTTAPAAAPSPTSVPAVAKPVVETDPAFGGARARAYDDMLATTIGTRFASSDSYTKAADYAAAQFAAFGYTVERQPFSFGESEVRRQEVRRPGSNALESAPLQNSGSGDVEAETVDAGLGRPADFPANTAGRIALVARGGAIPFTDKVNAATRAGAIAVVISNNEAGTFRGSLSGQATIPAIAISKEAGDALRAAGGPITLRVIVDIVRREIQAENVIATRRGGQGVIVIGAHLDSVSAGPGANDNASGSGAVLELARALAQKPTTSELRFALFGAEENGLIGSREYVRSLPATDRSRIRAMINLDMVGVGDTFQVGGTAEIARQVRDAATTLGQPTRAMSNDLSGASDHASFIQAGIPATFLYWSNDPDYHQATDVAANIRVDRLQTTGDVVMATVATLDGD